MGALVIGTIIDGAAGTPLIATGVLVSIAAVYAVSDITFAPASSDYRATLHDRFAGTVVVGGGPMDVEPTHEPASIAPRPRTSRLTLLNVAGGLYLLTLVAAVVIVVAVAGANVSGASSSYDSALSASTYDADDASDDSVDDADAAVSDDSGTGYGEGDTLDEALDEAIDDAEVNVSVEEPELGTTTVNEDAPSPNAALAAAKSAKGAQRQATGAAVVLANCLGRYNDFSNCLSDTMNGGFEPDVVVEGGAADPSTPKVGRSIAITDRQDDSSTLTILVHDRNGIGWGYTFTERGGTVEPTCTSTTAITCWNSKHMTGFTERDAPLKSVRKMYRNPVG